MTRKLLTVDRPRPFYRGKNVPKSAIRRFAQQVAKRFRPDKIILFGSHVYGRPHADSDVDILVVMRAKNQVDQAVKISLAIDPPFSLDVIVRTPHDLNRRLEDGDLFHTHIVTKGKVLYEKGDGGVDRKKAEEDYLAAQKLARSRETFHGVVCFHCQQCAEKYLKALLEELGLYVEKTHDLNKLYKVLSSHHPLLRSVHRGLPMWSRFAVVIRYPGTRTSKRQAIAALRWAGKVREACRMILGL